MSLGVGFLARRGRLGRLIVSLGFGGNTPPAPPPVVVPKITALLYALPVADAFLATAPLLTAELYALPAADAALFTHPETATLPG